MSENSTDIQLQKLEDTQQDKETTPESTTEENSPAAIIKTEKIDVKPINQSEQSAEISNGEVNQSESSVLQGSDNPGFALQTEDIQNRTEIPQLTYIDFMPRLLLPSDLKDQPPTFSRFGTLVEQANQWLSGNPEFTAFKCETIMNRVETTDKILTDSVLYMESAYGVTKYVMGLRLWLLPRSNTSLPVVQIGYTTALPTTKQTDQSDHSDSVQVTERLVSVSTSESLQGTVHNINKELVKRPIPGAILNVETVTFRRSQESHQKEAVDPDCTCWAENGSLPRLYVHGLRIYYIHGNSEFEKIGFHDQLPDFDVNAIGTGVKFGSYKKSVAKTSEWLKDQQGIRVVNMQSVEVRCELDPKGRFVIHSDTSGHLERPYVDTKYAKVLRTFYVKSPKSAKDVSYRAVNLTTRLFVPIRREGTTKGFESFSKTMQRMMKWMDYTRIPPLCVETVQYQVFLNGYGDIVNPDKVETNVARTAGRHQLYTVRLYFPSEFVEPPPEITPEVDTTGESGWGCVIS